MNTNLSAEQHDYAIFLPATSGFYSTFVGKQRYANYVDPARIPASFTSGVEGLNYLNPKDGMFKYKWCLYSAGHANLDLTKVDESEDMFRNRDRDTSLVLGDSGGFQVAKGVWPADWKDPNCPKAQKMREQVLKWLCNIADYGMTLDIPTWTFRNPEAAAASGIHSYEDAVKATKFNNEYFINNRFGTTKFLNVLQGSNHTEADEWYELMKGYCDPKQYPGRHFNGWGMGGQNMCDVELILRRLNALRFDGLLEEGIQDWMHFLGTSKLEYAVLLTDIQRAIRKHHNPKFTISFDCASPFLATANGQIYFETSTDPDEKWSYRMQPSADDKKYASDTRLFKDAVVQDGIFEKFESSPIIDQVLMKDICIYAPGHLNKVGKEGKTSWDSFSYAIMMGHNCWMHINAVQEANRQSDAGCIPYMLKDHANLDHIHLFKDIVDEIFAEKDRTKSDALIAKHKNYFTYGIAGTRGFTRAKSVNSFTKANELFEEVDNGPVTVAPSKKLTKAEKLAIKEEENRKHKPNTSLFDFE